MISTFAQKFVSLGISIIPIQYRDKRPAFTLLPNGWEEYKTRLTTQTELDAWSQHKINYGVVVGWGDLIVLDFDNTVEFHRWRLWAEKQLNPTRLISQMAFRVSTSRGVHLYLRLLSKSRNRKLGKIDLKADGYVLGPGSVHPSGAIYEPLSSMVFPSIQSLSDILPAALLAAHTEPSDVVKLPTIPVLSDPWAAINQPSSAITAGAVDRIKSKLRIEDMFQVLSPTSRDRRWQMTRCPLHDDHKPSMWVDVKSQLCGCFAGCTPKPLDSINLYARLNGLDNQSAIRLLADFYKG